MNDWIHCCYGDLTLNKLSVFFPGELSPLQGWDDLERITAGLPYRQDSISEQADFEETKLPTIRKRLRNAHLAAGWDIWLRFGSFLTHTKKKERKSARIWANPLSPTLSLPLPTGGWMWAKAVGPPDGTEPGAVRHILIVKWISKMWLLVAQWSSLPGYWWCLRAAQNQPMKSEIQTASLWLCPHLCLLSLIVFFFCFLTEWRRQGDCKSCRNASSLIVETRWLQTERDPFNMIHPAVCGHQFVLLPSEKCGCSFTTSSIVSHTPLQDSECMKANASKQINCPHIQHC